MNYKHILLLALSVASTVSFAQGPPGLTSPASAAAPEAKKSLTGAPRPAQTKATPELAGKIMSFEFTAAPLEVVLEDYCRWTGLIYLKTDAVKANITLKADKVTTEEAIKVVEAILAMNNVALVPMGDKYVKVIMATGADLTGQGLSLDLDPDTEYGSTDRFITKIIHLKNVEIPEVQAAVQHVMHSYGKIMGLQRSNSLMITDTEANIKRALEIIEFIDQGTAVIESRIYEIKHAEATEIATKLKEIVEAAQADQKQTATAAAPSNLRTPPGVIRAKTAPTPTKASIGQTESGAVNIIVGTVKILSDERTNIIIIFSQEENFTYFDKIIKVLDVEVEPATTFEVVNLEYADATELSGTLNDLIGAAGSSRSSSSSSSRNSTSRSGSTSSGTSRTSTSRTSGSTRMTPNSTDAAPSIENLNRLSEDTKILADERSNSIILMGSKGDIATIKEVIKQLDVMLEQVVIEAAIFEIGLDDELRHGIDWLYRADGDDKIGAWDGNSLITNAINNVASGALTYYQNLAGIDSQILINLAQTDTDARLVSTPVIMTTDNTEATLSIGEQRPVVTSTDSYVTGSGSSRSNYEYKDIGIQLTVTPRINPQRFVVMELTQKADQIGTIVEIDGNEVPTILNREFEASIAVPDGGTVVLGGLISTDINDTVTKIPILGDIPLIGRYLFSSVAKVEKQRELIVLMTPYVMTNNDEMRQQTERIYTGTNLRQENWKNNWSESPLRDIPDPEAEQKAQESEKEQAAE